MSLNMTTRLCNFMYQSILYQEISLPHPPQPVGKSTIFSDLSLPLTRTLLELQADGGMNIDGSLIPIVKSTISATVISTSLLVSNT